MGTPSRQPPTLSVFLLAAVVGMSSACNEPPKDPVIEAGQLYVQSASFRRQQLESSLVDPSNGYSRKRLELYTEEGWGALPVLDLPVAPVTGGEPPESGFSTLESDSVPWDRESLRALGEEAFWSYPLRPRPELGALAADPELYGGTVIDGRSAGLLWTEVPRGVAIPANSCATCHVALRDGDLVIGVANADLDMAAATAATFASPSDRGWGAGRIDVTGDGVDNPVTIPDIRNGRYETHLHRAGTVRNSLVALAIRLETLYITSHGETARPDRKVMFAMAYYLWTLSRAAILDTDHPGAVAYQKACARCHGEDGHPVQPVDLAAIGTDPTVGESPARGTGKWKVPSLVGVGDRGALTASGAFRSLPEFLDPNRDGGHLFTAELSARERADLADYLASF